MLEKLKLKKMMKHRNQEIQGNHETKLISHSWSNRYACGRRIAKGKKKYRY